MSALIIHPPPVGRVVRLELPDLLRWNDRALYEFCAANGEVKIEHNSDGEILVMQPAGPFSSSLELELGSQLMAWCRVHGG